MTQKSKSKVIELPSDTHTKRTKEIIYSIRRLMQAGELYSKELNKKYTISSAQLNCILALYDNGNLSPSHIAKHIMVNSSTVTGIIDRLEQKHLAKRMRISPDRRVVTIELTEDGKRLAENAPPPIQQKIIDGLKKMPEEEIEHVALSLKKLTSMLDVEDLKVT